MTAWNAARPINASRLHTKPSVTATTLKAIPPTRASSLTGVGAWRRRSSSTSRSAINGNQDARSINATAKTALDTIVIARRSASKAATSE